jgi:hypothetical protein
MEGQRRALKEDNATLKNKLEETNATQWTTMEAVFGVSHIIHFYSPSSLANLFDL